MRAWWLTGVTPPPQVFFRYEEPLMSPTLFPTYKKVRTLCWEWTEMDGAGPLPPPPSPRWFPAPRVRRPSTSFPALHGMSLRRVNMPRLMPVRRCPDPVPRSRAHDGAGLGEPRVHDPVQGALLQGCVLACPVCSPRLAPVRSCHHVSLRSPPRAACVCCVSTSTPPPTPTHDADAWLPLQEAAYANGCRRGRTAFCSTPFPPSTAAWCRSPCPPCQTCPRYIHGTHAHSAPSSAPSPCTHTHAPTRRL
jgi:hypothetical protein